MTLAEVAARLGAYTGQDYAYVEETLEQARESRRDSGLPEAVVEGMISSYLAIADGSLALTTDAVAELTGHPPLTLRAVPRSQPRAGGDSRARLRAVRGEGSGVGPGGSGGPLRSPDWPYRLKPLRDPLRASGAKREEAHPTLPHEARALASKSSPGAANRAPALQLPRDQSTSLRSLVPL